MLLLVVGFGALVLSLISLLFVLFSRQRQDFKEQISSFWKRLLVFRKRSKPVRLGTVMLPPLPRSFPNDNLQPFTIGNLKFPIRIFVGGDGQTRYNCPEGVVCTWNNARLNLPRDVQEAYPYFLEKRTTAAAKNDAVLEQREHIRIDDYSFRLRYSDDAPWPIIIRVSKTDYYMTLATNYSIEELLPGGRSLRETHAYDPGDLKNSVLSNPLAVNLSVVTRDKQILMAIRGRKVAVNPARGPGYTPAVSGTASPEDLDEDGNYSPFKTAIREASEEIVGSKPSLENVTFFGLARTMRWQFPFLFGELRLPNLSARHVKALLPRDHWEMEGLISLPLRPEPIVDFVREVYRKTDQDRITHSTIYAALFSVIQSLRYEFPDEWEDIVQELSEVQTKE